MPYQILTRAKAFLSYVMAVGLICTWGAALAQPLQTASVGVLRFTSSGPVFIALERGYFREAGLDVVIEYFQAAPPVALAAGSRDVAFGVTALTAATYNLVATGKLKSLFRMN